MSRAMTLLFVRNVVTRLRIIVALLLLAAGPALVFGHRGQQLFAQHVADIPRAVKRHIAFQVGQHAHEFLLDD